MLATTVEIRRPVVQVHRPSVRRHAAGPRDAASDDPSLVSELEFLDAAQVRLWRRMRRDDYARLHAAFVATIRGAMGAPARATPEADVRVLSGALAGNGRWAVLGLACYLEAATIESAGELEHAWRCEDALTTLSRKDRAIEELVALLLAVDRVLQASAGVAACEFIARCRPAQFTPWQQVRLGAQMLRACRWQHLVRGLRHAPFASLVRQLTTPVQQARLEQALRPIAGPFGTVR